MVGPPSAKSGAGLNGLNSCFHPFSSSRMNPQTQISIWLSKGNILSGNPHFTSLDGRGAYRGAKQNAVSAGWTNSMVNATDRQYEHTHSQNRFAVVPTALRLGIDTDRTARGVTMAFLDSGFYPHPDLTRLVSRIVAYKDIANPRATLKSKKV